tara:strand:- start:391 stop:651 length:261 start_codon:yes stop_codon:yes gene_type:complete
MVKGQSKTGQTTNKNKKMKIIYEPTTENWISKKDPNFIQKKVTLDHPMDDMTITEFMDNMIIPLLLSMGYSQVTINSVIETDEDKY